MRRVVIFIIVFGLSVPCFANICAYDQAPAASLLFPFVTFDYETPYGGETTVIAITNLSPDPQIVQVGLWTDLGSPFMEFDVVLAGYDVQRFNIRDVLYHGILPVTVSEDHEGTEGVFVGGPVSPGNGANHATWLSGALDQPVATSALEDRCSPEGENYPGLYADHPIPEGVLDLFELWLKYSHTVDLDLANDCELPFDDPYAQPAESSWRERRDELQGVWMWVTADVVQSCTIARHIEAEAWIPYTEGGEARYDNVLTGDLYWISGSTSTAMPAVHIEADRQLAQVATPNPTTGQPVSFYARSSNRLTDYSDYREPLPTAWALRFIGAENPQMTTRILAWKGSTNFERPYDLEFVEPDDLGLHPDSLVASEGLAYTVYIWDEDSNVYANGMACDDGDEELPDICPNLFPFVTQEVSVNEFNPMTNNGWMLFVWPDSNYGGLEGAPEAPDFYQTWMGIRQTAWGTHEDYMPGTPVANANCFADQVLPDLGINYDYVKE